MHSLWHHFDKLMQCHNINFPSRAACIFHWDPVLMMEESSCCAKSSPAHPKDSQRGLRSGLCGGQSMCENDVSRSLNHSFTVWAWWIVALSSWNISVPSGKNKSIDGTAWLFGIFRKSADLIFWSHNVAEPRPDQLKQPQMITLPPQTCVVDTRHDGCITSSSSLLTSLWNRVHLDTSEHMTFSHWAQSLCAPANWSLCPPISLTDKWFLKVIQLFSPSALSYLRIVHLEMPLRSLLHIAVGSTVDFFPI